jgi:ornithine cyclodeaminase/alanine dehydrogenase-like protein (mu-crystallin family)
MRNAFRLYSAQRMVPALRVPSPLPAPAPPDAGAMILVPGVVAGIPAYTVKVHAKYPARDPAIQGVIVLSSLETGETLAIIESGFLTALPTGLAGAIGADVLARRDARTVAIIGGSPGGAYPAGAVGRLGSGFAVAAVGSPYQITGYLFILSIATEDGINAQNGSTQCSDA